MPRSLLSLALLSFISPASASAEPTPPATPGVNPPAPTVKAYPPQILEHKGTAFGRDYPKWMDAALDGPRAVEKLADYANKYVVVVQESEKLAFRFHDTPVPRHRGGAAILIQPYQPYPPVSYLSYPFACIVARAVVHYDQLQVPERLIQRGTHGLADKTAAIVRAYYDGDFG